MARETYIRGAVQGRRFKIDRAIGNSGIAFMPEPKLEGSRHYQMGYQNMVHGKVVFGEPPNVSDEIRRRLEAIGVY